MWNMQLPCTKQPMSVVNISWNGPFGGWLILQLNLWSFRQWFDHTTIIIWWVSRQISHFTWPFVYGKWFSYIFPPKTCSFNIPLNHFTMVTIHVNWPIQASLHLEHPNRLFFHDASAIFHRLLFSILLHFGIQLFLWNLSIFKCLYFGSCKKFGIIGWWYETDRSSTANIRITLQAEKVIL